MFCPSCGRQIPDRSQFCLSCGKPVSTPEIPPASSRTGTPVKIANVRGYFLGLPKHIRKSGFLGSSEFLTRTGIAIECELHDIHDNPTIWSGNASCEVYVSQTFMINGASPHVALNEVKLSTEVTSSDFYKSQKTGNPCFSLKYKRALEITLAPTWGSQASVNLFFKGNGIGQLFRREDFYMDAQSVEPNALPGICEILWRVIKRGISQQMQFVLLPDGDHTAPIEVESPVFTLRIGQRIDLDYAKTAPHVRQVHDEFVRYLRQNGWELIDGLDQSWLNKHFRYRSRP